jgi:D-galactarolactone cycloisomerase
VSFAERAIIGESFVGDGAEAAFTPHTWTNGLGLLANLHVTAGIGGGPFIEFPYDPPGWTPERRDFMLAEPLKTDAEGCISVPNQTGLGVELDETALLRYDVEAS